MKKVLIISLFLTFLFQVKSQNTEVEIYMVQSNTIVKGTVVASSTDSLSIRVDSLNSLTFAKSELEGRDFPVSKEVKRLRRKLAISESEKLPDSFPGIYQIRKGQILKGGIMFILTSAGIIGVVASGGVFIAGLASVQGLWSLFTLAADSFMIFAPSILFLESGIFWSGIDRLYRIKKMLNNRYYYLGATVPEMITVQQNQTTSP